MGVITVLAVVLALGCSSVCSGPQTPHLPDPPDPVGVAPEAPSPKAAVSLPIRVATFNIQILGKTKVGKPDVLAKLASIIRRYDVVAVQEIKDKSGKAPRALLDAINEGGGFAYGMLLSARGGQQPDDQRSQEQYAVFYRVATIEALPGDRLYDDSAADQFQREPYLTHLKVKGQPLDFVLVQVHTRPDSAVEEIGALHDVVTWAKKVFPGEGDVLVMGDFNAGCSYASPEELDALAIRGPGYTWVVPDTADTNLAKSSCAYDRIVTHGTLGFTGEWGIDEAFTDKRVSDHWPVWAEFRASP